ncbi:MAG TPA: VanW family protein [Candidatus Limnocylindrales bacterium]|nr:VanW family protein [Candidatus Limnocylindrales bacterium]
MTDLPNRASDGDANATEPETGADATELTELPAPTEATEATDDATATTSLTEPDGAVVPMEPLAASVTEATGPRPRRRRSLALRFVVAFVVGFALMAGIGGGVLYAWGREYDGRILPGVSVGSTYLGGLTREEAASTLASAFASLGTGEITLNGPDGQMSIISFTEVGRGPDTTRLVDAALAAGRHDDPLTNLIRGPQAAINGVTLDSAVTYDREKLVAAVESLATSLDQTPTDATVSPAPGGTYTVSPAKDGRAVDKAALLTSLDQQLMPLESPSSITMAVPMVALPPTVPTASAEAAKAAADRMAADIVVTRKTDSWTVSGKSLASLVSFQTAPDGTITPVLDQKGLDPLLTKLAKQVNRSAQNAGLRLVNGRVVATGSSHEGRTLKAAGMRTALLAEIAARQGGAPAQKVAAAVKAVKPKLTIEDAKAYAGRMKMISSYSVYYWVIINNHWGGNIEGPATVINGTVVPAGTVFDFWKVVGNLRNAPGVGPGNAIEGGKITVTGAFGGGICTTSTTLFNAAFRAGMVPMARQNHNEFITRYPPGLDATVWIVGNTKQTMSFRNDTKYPILITRTVTHAGNKRWLTFKIWSVPNGRVAKVTNTVIQHGPRAIDTVVRDPSKPVGYRYRNNAPADGARVWVTVSIYDHGKLHWSKRYFSRYPAVNGVLVVGTG